MPRSPLPRPSTDVATARQPPAGERRERQRRRRERPRLVARQARAASASAAARRAGRCGRPAQASSAEHRQHQQREQQRLGHRRRLQVEQVRIEREQGGGRSPRHASPWRAARCGARPSTRAREARDRDRHARRARAVEQVHLHGQQVQQVGQRQPHGADLLPARREAVEDAPRDDQVRLGIVVAQRQARRVVVPRDDGAPERDRRGHRERDPAVRGRCGGGRVAGLAIIVGDDMQNDVTRGDGRRAAAHESVRGLAPGLCGAIGGPGLFIIAFLDSSFLSLPEINDLLVVIGRHAASATGSSYYAAHGDAGSLAGCLALYVVGAARRRGARAVAVQQRAGSTSSMRALPALRRPRHPRAVAAAAAGAVQDLHPARRRQPRARLAVRRSPSPSGAACGSCHRRCSPRGTAQQTIDFIHEHQRTAGLVVVGLILAGDRGLAGRQRRRRRALTAPAVTRYNSATCRRSTSARPACPDLSIVIPVRNEAPNIEPLYPRADRDARGVGAHVRDPGRRRREHGRHASRSWRRCRRATRGCASSASAATSARRRRLRPASPTRAAATS